MNQLSWLLYLADVAGSSGWAICGVFVISALVVAITLVAAPLSEGEAITEENRPKWLKILKTFAASAIISFVLMTLIPAKETVYAIAASEIGEQVATSPTGQKALRAIDAWLDRQIEGEKPAAE